MKEKILRALREAEGDFVSGQRLCEQLQVSRQAISKNILALREAGYQIESVPHKGHRLCGVPDRLMAPEIMSRLPEGSICRKVIYCEQVDSTNTKAKQLAEIGEPEGTLVVAEEQTAGKGRRGRGWVSEPGVGVWMSLILRPELAPEESSCITLVTALAVAEGISKTCGLAARIKWPNDIILNGKKVCGILTEMSSEREYIHYVVVGVGINVNTRSFPDESCTKATSLFIEKGGKVDRQALIAACMESFGKYYGQYLKMGNMTLLQEEYDRLLINRDREVRVFHGVKEEVDQEQIETGIARGITPEGALLVETKDGTCTVISGEVSVRGVYGYI